MAVHARFDFYEEVRVSTSDPNKAHLNGETGVILGRVETEDKKSWYYGVDFSSTNGGWCFYEDELIATGRKFQRSDFYDGSSVRVQVDEKGRGRIVSPNDDDRKSSNTEE